MVLRASEKGTRGGGICKSCRPFCQLQGGASLVAAGGRFQQAVRDVLRVF